ncbi:hypothetical protein MMC16_007877 [Acarospora aff. strigata]|nr:hypothetical protein [Acarospora aff. strigata]
MEKLKNLINPGAKHDEEVMYGSGRSSDPVHSGNTGGVSGQGSHAGSSHTGTNPLPSGTNPTSSGGLVPGHGSNSTGIGQHTGLTGNAVPSSNVAGGFDDGASTASIKSGILGQPQSGAGLISSSGTGDSLDTNKPLPNTPSSGLTGLNTTAGPHSSTLGSRAEPRVDPDLDRSRGLGRSAGGESLTGSTLPDRSVGSSGYGTGAGSGGIGGGMGTGIVVYGPEHWEHDHHRHGHQYAGDPCAHGEADPAGPHLTSGPHATDTANRLDPHVAGDSLPLETVGDQGHHHGHHGTSAISSGIAPTGPGSGLGTSSTGAGLGPTGTGSGYGQPGPGFGLGTSSTGAGLGPTGSGSGYGAPASGYNNPTDDRHFGRDATLAGGLGAAGVGAYDAKKQHHNHGLPDISSVGPTTSGSATGPNNPYTTSGIDPRVESTSRSGIAGTGNDHHHLGRDAGLAGAGVGGVAAHEGHKHHLGRDEPSRTSGLSGTTTGTSGRDHDSTRDSARSAAGSLSNTSHHHHGRDPGPEFSKHEAEKHEKDDHSHEGKKHGGLLGFLHHDKDKDSHKDKSASHSSNSHDSQHGSKAAGVGAVGAGTAAYEHEKGDHERNRLHKDPPEGYASQVTGGTGTTSLAQGDSTRSGPHASGLGNKLDPNVADRGDTLPPGEVIEPHTGLPMNIAKYGTGAGGTDNNPIPGYHKH